MKKILTFIKTRKFFVAVLVLFCLQAGWIALSSDFPLTYDESYHVGAVAAYSDQLTPFVANQTQSESFLGDITRYGSYFYHYAMSFPYRFVSSLNGSHFVLILSLRVISIAIFATALFYSKRLLRVLGFSDGVANLSILVTVLLPTTSFLAATVNYDGLFFLFAALHLIAAVKLREGRYRDTWQWAAFVATGALGAVTKYSFLPILAATGLYAVVSMLRDNRGLVAGIVGNYQKQRAVYKVAIVLLIAVPAILFCERYVVNVVSYRSVQPECSTLHSVDSCKMWGPWGRNYLLDGQHPDQPATLTGLMQYFVNYWYPGTRDSLTLVGGMVMVGNVPTMAMLMAGRPLLFMLNVVIIIGAWSIVTTSHTLRKKTAILQVLLAAGFYVLALLLTNFSDFLKFGQAVGVQGRYVLLFVPLFSALALYGANLTLNKLYSGKKALRAKACTMVVVFVIFAQFGGLITYISNSQPSWFWPNNWAAKINNRTRPVLNRFVIGR